MQKKWSKKTVVKYTLLQIPATALLGLALFYLGGFLNLAVGHIWTILGLWVIKDLILFFYLWPAYEEKPQNHMLSMIGREGISREKLAPWGYIRVGGTLWRARVSPELTCIDEGEKVQIVGRNGLTLEVRPIKSSAD